MFVPSGALPAGEPGGDLVLRLPAQHRGHRRRQGRQEVLRLQNREGVMGFDLFHFFSYLVAICRQFSNNCVLRRSKNYCLQKTWWKN